MVLNNDPFSPNTEAMVNIQLETVTSFRFGPREIPEDHPTPKETADFSLIFFFYSDMNEGFQEPLSPPIPHPQQAPYLLSLPKKQNAPIATPAALAATASGLRRYRPRSQDAFRRDRTEGASYFLATPPRSHSSPPVVAPPVIRSPRKIASPTKGGESTCLSLKLSSSNRSQRTRSPIRPTPRTDWSPEDDIFQKKAVYYDDEPPSPSRKEREEFREEREKEPAKPPTSALEARLKNYILLFEDAIKRNKALCEENEELRRNKETAAAKHVEDSREVETDLKKSKERTAHLEKELLLAKKRGERMQELHKREQIKHEATGKALKESRAAMGKKSKKHQAALETVIVSLCEVGDCIRPAVPSRNLDCRRVLYSLAPATGVDERIKDVYTDIDAMLRVRLRQTITDNLKLQTSQRKARRERSAIRGGAGTEGRGKDTGTKAKGGGFSVDSSPSGDGDGGNGGDGLTLDYSASPPRILHPASPPSGASSRSESLKIPKQISPKSKKKTVSFPETDGGRQPKIKSVGGVGVVEGVVVVGGPKPLPSAPPPRHVPDGEKEPRPEPDSHPSHKHIPVSGPGRTPLWNSDKLLKYLADDVVRRVPIVSGGAGGDGDTHHHGGVDWSGVKRAERWTMPLFIPTTKKAKPKLSIKNQRLAFQLALRRPVISHVQQPGIEFGGRRPGPIEDFGPLYQGCKDAASGHFDAWYLRPKEGMRDQNIMTSPREFIEYDDGWQNRRRGRHDDSSDVTREESSDDEEGKGNDKGEGAQQAIRQKRRKHKKRKKKKKVPPPVILSSESSSETEEEEVAQPPPRRRKRKPKQPPKQQDSISDTESEGDVFNLRVGRLKKIIKEPGRLDNEFIPLVKVQDGEDLLEYKLEGFFLKIGVDGTLEIFVGQQIWVPYYDTAAFRIQLIEVSIDEKSGNKNAVVMGETPLILVDDPSAHQRGREWPLVHPDKPELSTGRIEFWISTERKPRGDDGLVKILAG
eukprot:GHVN01034355.1.p1 GENE.GHVN01034355.1~~GHVN01034355.1.p1  ORF type:complete len:979 (-),score=215.29 GHVN01034355.1:348-3284(-)